MKKRFNLTTLLIIAAAVVLLVVIVSTFRDGEDVAVTVNTGETSTEGTSAGEDANVTVTVTDEDVAVTVNTGGTSSLELNFYNWSDYIAEDTLANFTEATGIQVIYDVFDSNEVLEAKLLAGGTGYDIVVPSGAFLERQIQAGVFQPLDKDKLTNYGNLDEELMSAVARHDPGNAHAVPYLWGTTGIGFNVEAIKERLGEDYVVDTWDLLFDPEVISRVADCGVHFLNAESEVVEIVLNYLGLDPHSEDSADYERAQALLESVRPHITKFHSSAYIDALAAGDICVALGWSGDVFQARNAAAESGNGVVIDYIIPKEGTVLWFDLLAIPADAANVENAHALIDYLLEPEVIGSISSYVEFANANKYAEPYVDAGVFQNPSVYPPPEVRQRLFADRLVSQETTRLRTRIWQEVTAGG